MVNFGEWGTVVSDLLAHEVAGNEILAGVRSLSITLIGLALWRSKGRHWTLRWGLAGLLILLLTDVVVGLGAGRSHGLTVTLFLRNLCLMSFAYSQCRHPDHRAPREPKALPVQIGVSGSQIL